MVFHSDVTDVSPNADILLADSVDKERKTRSLNLNNLLTVQRRIK